MSKKMCILFLMCGKLLERETKSRSSNLTKNEINETEHPMMSQQIDIGLVGSLINLFSQKGLSRAAIRSNPLSVVIQT